jgi:hypothetical protein
MASWTDVPARVEGLYAEIVDDARAALAAYADVPCPVYFHTGEKMAWAMPFAPPGDEWVEIKRAEAFLRPAADAFAGAQKHLGGPNPLTASIVGGLVGAGLGYGGGALAEQLLPRQHFSRGRLRKSLATMGGIAGAVPGAIWAGANLQNPDDTGGGLRALTSPWPMDQKVAVTLPRAWEKVAWRGGADEDFSGGLYMPTIPKDAFNNAVWSDALRAPNPFGTKSPWGSNDQALATPMPVAAAVTGIVAGTAAATGQQAVSPWQVGLTAAATAGKGYLAGLAFGKTLGALAGLSPEAQATMRSAGLWGGLLAGAVDSLFG